MSLTYLEKCGLRDVLDRTIEVRWGDGEVWADIDHDAIYDAVAAIIADRANNAPPRRRR